MMIQILDKNIWTGRFDDEDGELGKRWHQVIQTKLFSELNSDAKEKIALLGFCSDEGVRRNKWRKGAKNATNFIRKACANLPFKSNKPKQIYDFGNIILEN